MWGCKWEVHFGSALDDSKLGDLKLTKWLFLLLLVAFLGSTGSQSLFSCPVLSRN